MPWNRTGDDMRRSEVHQRVLVTGGAGFIGSTVALAWKRTMPDVEVIALDNLKRRGSELSLPRLRTGGVRFEHGDIRNPEDIDAIGPVDLLIECSAEPSVHAGYGQSPAYLINSNLAGLVNCLEHLRRTGGDLIFLSSSRVYPIKALRSLPMERVGHSFTVSGAYAAGIPESFRLTGARSLYGATKLAAELLIEEYRETYAMRAIVNRCGVIAGPWQMGKVDQGFVALWMARHLYGGPLAYTGFGGEGAQVRDLLHVEDLCDLLRLQAKDMERHHGAVWNVGGGLPLSLSLWTLSQRCATRVCRSIPVASDPETRAADIPWYVTDHRAVTSATEWTPQRDVATILDDVYAWLTVHRTAVQPILGA